MKHSKRYAVLLLTTILAVLFFYIVNQDQPAQDSLGENSQPKNVENADATKLYVGSSNALTTIIEYFDYKCPRCNDFHQTIEKEINANYTSVNKTKFEIRITPIIGPDSGNAARGAYCANDQNYFEEYHEKVLNYMWENYYKDGNFSAELENIFTTDKLSEIVEPLGIDTLLFKSCVDSEKFNPNLDLNLELAADDSIQGTPGFKIGNQSFIGVQPFSVYKTLLDIELRE